MGHESNLSRPGIWSAAAGTLFGIILAVALAAGYHASGNPAFCISCHSMKDIGSHWQQSQHKQFACIECHLPDSTLIPQVTYKTKAGLNDLYHETLRSYPSRIRLSEEARDIAEGNCLRCHFSTVQNTFMAAGGECLKCHQGLVHGSGQETGGIKVE